MFNLQADEKLVSQYRAAMQRLESKTGTRKYPISPYQSSNESSWIKDIQITPRDLDIKASEREEIETYFDKYVKPLYDFTEEEIRDSREIFVCTVKSTLGVKSFAQWIKEQTQSWGRWRPRSEPTVYLHGHDKEGYGHGK